MNIGIVGGGIMGLALAQRLAARGQRVTVLEREPQLGGLSTWHDYGAFTWDRFYHVILPGDAHLIRFLTDIGLADRLRWSRTRTGFFVDEQMHSMSTTAEFLRFRPVGLFGKVRMALTILYCARINDWRRLERKPLEPWLLRLSGRATYEKFWKPLLLAKLGEHYRRASAVFIWTYIKRMYAARSSAARQEQLGHVAGGYRTVIERAGELIRKAGGTVTSGITVRRIAAETGGGMRVETDRGPLHFDKVIFTGPVNVLERVAPVELAQVQRPQGTVEYLGVICLVLVTRKPVVPYYIVNIADARVPFTGIIGMSNVVAPEETAGMHVTYLPKYVHSDDELLKRSDEELQAMFLEGLRRMLPEFEQAEIVSVHVNRAIKVQPLQVVGYSELVPQVRSAHPDFFVLNTSQFVNNTLNNNEVLRAVDGFLAQYADTLGPAWDSAPARAATA
jgi:protoporphyrinogen oxidase